MCSLILLCQSSELWQMVKEIGLPAAVAVIFVCKDLVRSKADSLRIEAMEKFIREDLSKLNRDNLEIITGAMQCLNDVKRILEK